MGDPGKELLMEALERSIKRTRTPMADAEHDMLRDSMHTVLIVLRAQCSTGKVTLRQVVAYGAAAGAFISG